MRFINRTDELNSLEREYKRKGSSFVVLYGRRRLGKTRLLREFFQGKKGIFHASIEATRHIQLNRFRGHLADFLKDRFLERSEVTDWEVLFDYLADRIAAQYKETTEKIILVIDEFQYLVKTDPALPSILQQIWDHKLQHFPVMLILCGSAVSMMHEHVLNASSPLYGRRTAQVRLRPVEFADYGKFVKKDIKERLKFYSITGGVPKYIELIGDQKIKEFISNVVLDVDGYLYEEPSFLLVDEIRKYVNYYSILQAISRGCRKVADIGSFIGLSAQALGPYLEILKEMHLIERIVPITEQMPHKSRKGLYTMADPFAAFWFRYIPRYFSELEQGRKNHILKIIMEDLPNHMGPIFENICKNVISRPKFREQNDFSINDSPKVGSWWNRQNEIDIVAIDEQKSTLILGECKLGQAGYREIASLQNKGLEVIDHYQPKRVVYAVFADRITGIQKNEEILTVNLNKLESYFD